MKDKILLKISGIISIILGVILCITIIGAFVGVPLIIGGCKFKDYSEYDDEKLKKEKDNILIWSIVFVFINLVSGILGIIFILMNEIDFNNIKPNKKYDNLEKIKKLYDDKVLTKEEYEKEKEKILNN